MKPLAEKLRPKQRDEWVGHSVVMNQVWDAFQQERFFSFILYGPPGSGKTSLAHLIKKSTRLRFFSLNAVTSGVKELRSIIEEAKLWQQRQNLGSILFIDEIHRFNKAQQDALLNAVERGDIILIGATTENPSFEVIPALLSRVRVFRLEALSGEEIFLILKRAVENLSRSSETFEIDEGALEKIAELCHGDARLALNAVERLFPQIKLQRVEQYFERKFLAYDKAGQNHYDVISAFIKSMRAGEEGAALYYLARMWDAGEDPKFIARRMLIFASEDVGNADLKALAMANATRQAVEFVGRPECFYALSQACSYLSRAPKSREAGEKFQKALDLVKKRGHQRPPNFLTNAVNSLDRKMGKGGARRSNESFLPKENI